MGGVMRTRQTRGTNTVAAGATLDITGACGCVQISTLIAFRAPRVVVVWTRGTNGSNAMCTLASLLAARTICRGIAWMDFVLDVLRARTSLGTGTGCFNENMQQGVTARLAHCCVVSLACCS